MKRKIILTGILLFTLFIVAVVAQPSMPGVPTKVSIRSQEVVNAAAFAIEAQEKAIQDSKGGQTNKLELVQIMEAKEVIAGAINYQLILQVKVNGKEKQAVANVCCQASNKLDPYQLTYWKWREEIFINGYKKAETNEPPAITAPLFSRVFLFPLDSVVWSRMRLEVPPEKDETSQGYLLRYFKTKQVEFQSPAFLKYEEATGKLKVHATEADLDKIERLITPPEEKK